LRKWRTQDPDTYRFVDLLKDYLIDASTEVGTLSTLVEWSRGWIEAADSLVLESRNSAGSGSTSRRGTES
jgi:hypothetical protein